VALNWVTPVGEVMVMVSASNSVACLVSLMLAWGVFQCRAQHWYVAPDVQAGTGLSPQDYISVRAQAEIAGDGCIYPGLGYSDGAMIRTAVGDYLCKSHRRDRK
jgi:hypothetical protein